MLALDAGSTGTRGGLFDATGRPIQSTRLKVDHAFRTSTKGRAEIDADTIVEELAAVLTAVAKPAFSGRIAAVALDTFPATVGVDTDDAALTPAYTYAEGRSAPYVTKLRQQLDEAALQQRTGARLGIAYAPARLAWLRNTQPDTFELVSTWMTLGEYVAARLLGARGVDMGVAAWTGLLNRTTGTWDQEVIAAVGARLDQFAPVLPAGTVFRDIPRSVTKRWPALKGAVWLPAIPDGVASHVGPGIEGVTLSSSTSGSLRMLVRGSPERVPTGLWAHRTDPDHTMVGGTLGDVGRVISWMDTVLAGSSRGMRNAWLSGPPHEFSPVMLPFLTGEKSVGWHQEARAALAGLSAQTDLAAFFRGAVEGVAFAYRRVLEQIVEVSGPVPRVVATGGISQSLPGWLNVAAGALNLPVTPVPIKRSTLRGTALRALDVVAPEVERRNPPLGAVLEPDERWVGEYQSRYERWLQLYAGTIS